MFYHSDPTAKFFFYFSRAIRYEDFCKDTENNTRTVLQFLKFKMDSKVLAFVKLHSKYNIGGVSSTYRISKTAPYHWINELNFSEIQKIQEKCNLAMKLWGYRKINTSEQLENLKDPDINLLMDYNL